MFGFWDKDKPQEGYTPWYRPDDKGLSEANDKIAALEAEIEACVEHLKAGEKNAINFIKMNWM